MSHPMLAPAPSESRANTYRDPRLDGLDEDEVETPSSSATDASNATRKALKQQRRDRFTQFREPQFRREQNDPFKTDIHSRVVLHSPEVLRCALHNAVSAGKLDDVKSCEQAGASLEWRDEAPGALGMTCLHLAVVAAAADHNAAPKPLNGEDGGAVHTSAAATFNRAADRGFAGTRNDRLDVLRYLLEEKKCNVDVCDYVEATPLHCAAALGDEEVIRVLCKHKASVRATDAEGLTPLHLAANCGQVDAARALVDCWAPLEAAENVPEPPPKSQNARQRDRDREKQNQHVAPVGASLYVARRGTPLHVATASNRDVIVRLLVSAGADVNSPMGPHEATPLHIAARCGFDVVARTLLELGADVNARDAMGETPLMRAAEGEHEGIVKLLMALGASAGVHNERGLTALHIAAACGRRSLFAPLVQGGADVNARTTALYEDYDGGRTPMHYAAHYGDAACFAELRRLGGDPRALSLVGWTPLFYAVEAGKTSRGQHSEAHLSLVTELIEMEKEHLASSPGEYPYPTAGSKHRTPLMLAVLQDWKEGVHLIAGAFPEMVHHADGDGRTAMHWGATRCLEKILTILHDDYGARGDVRDKEGKMPGDLWTGTVKPAPRRQWEEPRRGALDERVWDYTVVMEHTTFEYTKKALAARRVRAIAQERQCLFCERFCFDAKRCGACKEAWYCGSECQKKHWPAHRLVCRTKFVGL